MLISFVILFVLIFWFFSIAPYVPTKSIDLKRINNIVNKKSWESFYEIWCWDWRVCHFIAKNNPNKKVIWIEFSPLFYFVSKIRYFLSPLDNLEIIYWNALKDDFSKYDVFYVFGLDETIKNKLKPKFESELKVWSRIISYVFNIENSIFHENKYKEDDSLLSIYEYERY